MRDFIRFNIWRIRRFLSRLFYKKWFVLVDFEDGGFFTAEIDLEKEKIFINKNGRVAIKQRRE